MADGMNHTGVPVSDSVTSSSDTYESQSQLGTAVIICNVNFSLVDRGGKKITLEPRTEQEKDIPRLEEILHRLGFKVNIYIDKTTTEMLTILGKAAKEIDPTSSCILCIISSHGDWHTFSSKGKTYLGDLVYGTDGVIPIKLLINGVQTDRLRNKPKIFLFQSCRGTGYMSNIDITERGGKVTSAERVSFKGSTVKHVDGSREINPERYMTERGWPYDVPIKKDNFLHFATCPGYVSFPQGGVGTPFLQAWCDVLSQKTYSREIHDLATLVNAKVCDEYETKNKAMASVGRHQRKQAPCIVSMFTKDFNFPMYQQKEQTIAEITETLAIKSTEV